MGGGLDVSLILPGRGSHQAGRHRCKTARYALTDDDEVKVLTRQISFLEEEIAALCRGLADSPQQTRLFEERLRGTETNLRSISTCHALSRA
jgi:hypothetical protein